MASYDLNAILKKKAAQEAGKPEEEMHLDDTARVKVLSPGRQVFKRFIRNRLAVFGSVLLICMFAFSFLGPLFYAYGQTDIFYKYDAQNINYALAQIRKEYNGYQVDENVSIERQVSSKINTYVSEMESAGQTLRLVSGSDGAFYEIEKLGDGIYTASTVDASKVADFGTSQVFIGTYSQVGSVMSYEVDPLGSGFESALKQNCKGTEGSFSYGGTDYTFTKGSAPKSYDIYATAGGFVYAAGAMDAEFEAAAETAAMDGASTFDFDGETYAVLDNGSGSYSAYTLANAKTGMVFTRFAIDTRATGGSVSDEFRNQALLAAYGEGAFTADGQNYTITREEDAIVIYDAAGEAYAEMSPFVIRRYNGDDTMAFDLKIALREAITAMTDQGEMSTELTYSLPQQNEAGEYTYDEEGNLLYADTDMVITQRLEGEYVINCEQIIYLIDRYSTPSAAHILGTDGDGFDVLARIMYGGRVSLMVGFVVVIIETILGVIMGGLAGYFGGWVDNLIMRLVDIFYCLPMMPIMIILGTMMDAVRMDTYIRLMVMMAALGLMSWAGVARLVRGQILSLREQEFMTATEATGMRIGHRIFKHLVPNVMPQLIVVATMGLGSVILTESTLSYLGLGVKHPLATWGTMINSVSSANAMQQYTYIWIPVGLLICLTVIAFNFVGDGLRDAYDPKSKS